MLALVLMALPYEPGLLSDGVILLNGLFVGGEILMKGFFDDPRVPGCYYWGEMKR